MNLERTNNPGWVHNLAAFPAAVIEVAGQRVKSARFSGGSASFAIASSALMLGRDPISLVTGRPLGRGLELTNAPR